MKYYSFKSHIRQKVNNIIDAFTNSLTECTMKETIIHLENYGEKEEES